MATPTKLAVLLHADIVDSTSHVRVDEVLAHERFQKTFRQFAATITNWGGIPHEIRGDALVAEFQRASDAASAAMEFQAENQLRLADIEGAIRPELRIGIALGEVVIADGTVTGAGVVLAQRLEQLASPSGVCISPAIREALPDRLSLSCEDLGQHSLKGLGFPQQAYALSSAATENPSADPKLARRGRWVDQRASIVVLPFDNLSADGDQDFFVDGMTSDIITGLSRFKELIVIARGTAFTFKGKSIDIAKLGKELNVKYVLEGSIRSANDRVRVSAQLVDTGNAAQIWGDRFDRTLDDVFELQDELTEAVVTAVAPQIARAESEQLHRVKPSSYDVWSLVQLALARFRESTSASIDEAFELLSQAIKVDPAYAQAYAWLSLIEMARRRMFGISDSPDRSREWAETAIRCDPQDAICHTALGAALIFAGETERAIAALQTAVNLNPNFTLAHERLGVAYLRSSQPGIALQNAEYVLRLSPYDLRAGHAYMLKGVALRRLERYEEAIENSRMAAHLMPELPVAQVHHAVTCALSGQLDEGHSALQRAKKLMPDLTIEGFRRHRGFEGDFSKELTEGLRRLNLAER